jgi:hypothetical protein
MWSSWHASCHPVQVPRFEPFPALRYAPTVDLDLALLRRHRATPGETDPSKLGARPLRLLS